MAYVNELYYQLFANIQFMSTQLRIILLILIILDLIFNNTEIKKFMLIFYIPSIMAFIVTLLGLCGYRLQKKYGFFKDRFKLLQDDCDNLHFYILGLVIKFIILLYILKYNKVKLTNDILCITIVYMAIYYFTFNVRKVYKTYPIQDIIVIIITLLLTRRCENFRLN